ncbi:pseudouridine synthase [Pleomassaria siparia CBS 279.74]|uniref:tRNA pseudouridine(55) synthase n=1 Tax=Pleomassaria siparia CBS 279.74 TaxID=1314801 RepID=A0A6G1K0T4_9PLEO|nr:pseudouridine synthase [Pleomassaria siparia CBS 279.74]
MLRTRSLWCNIMSTSPKPAEKRKVLEGIFAINKPQWASSAGVLRDLQTHFQPSTLFAPWLDSTRRNMTLSHSKKKHIESLKVKVGHGGTLDPLATGVLIVGVGRGTKLLGRFLECTKTYECVVLFGAATDSYDAVGKIVSRAPYDHVTRELVEEKLDQFRGKIMQKPSIFSALKVDGKKMYEYARAGGEVPEVAARPVEVLELELVEWLEPGKHEFAWPTEEVDGEQKVGAEKLMGVRLQDARGVKRSRSPELEVRDHVTGGELHPKRPKTDDEPAMSGALPVKEEPSVNQDESIPQEPKTVQDETAEASITIPETATNDPIPDGPVIPSPPAARLRMTVTSGFYVRSLCHDLGLACSSFGLMSSLVRSRQGDYSLQSPTSTVPSNVFEYSDLELGPSVWVPKIQKLLEGSMEKEGWEIEEIEEEDEWKKYRTEHEERKKENDRDRSYQGGRKGGRDGGGKGERKRGKRGGNSYSKNMNQGGQRNGDRTTE